MDMWDMTILIVIKSLWWIIPSLGYIVAIGIIEAKQKLEAERIERERIKDAWHRLYGNMLCDKDGNPPLYWKPTNNK